MAIGYFDAHCDTLTRFQDLYHSGETHLDLQRLSRYEGAGQVFALWAAPGEDTPEEFARLMDRLEQQLTLHGNAAMLCTSVAEADAAAAGGKTAVFVAVEGAALLGCTLAGLVEGYRRGVRLVTLCWNKDNRLCGAAFDSGSGLTEAGQEFVRACWKTGVAVDLSHASEQTFWDVLAVAQRPVICTHSNAKALCDHPRNLTDEQIRAIVANDGCVGLNFCTDFLGGNRDVEAIVDHAEHFLTLGAVKNLCLGTDFDGIEETPLGMAGVQDMPVLYDAMLRRGLSEATVQDIFYGNLRNYLQKAL